MVDDLSSLGVKVQFVLAESEVRHFNDKQFENESHCVFVIEVSAGV